MSHYNLIWSKEEIKKFYNILPKLEVDKMHNVALKTTDPIVEVF